MAANIYTPKRGVLDISGRGSTILLDGDGNQTPIIEVNIGKYTARVSEVLSIIIIEIQNTIIIRLRVICVK